VRGYSRTARINEVLREVLADQLERIEINNERLGMLTITAVDCDPDLRHATVLLSSMSEADKEALASARDALQSSIATELQLRRTPQLRFVADPAVATGMRIEEILGQLPPSREAEPDADKTPDDAKVQAEGAECA
jgi:ribosome-binding factor A